MKHIRKRNKSRHNWIWLVVLALVYLYYQLESYGFSRGMMNLILIGFIALSTVMIIGASTMIKHFNRQKYLNSPLGVVDKMSGEEFEKYLKAHFENMGYNVKLTPASHDFGADLVCKGKGETIIVQAKRYNKKVGNSAIQEIVAAKGYYKSDRCMVVTNSFFTKPAIELARSNNVELWDRKSINVFFKSPKSQDNIIKFRR